MEQTIARTSAATSDTLKIGIVIHLCVLMERLKDKKKAKITQTANIY